MSNILIVKNAKYFIYYFWHFIIGSIFGFLIETIWCLIKNKKYESRKGLIYGPFTPIYGLATLSLSIIINLFNLNSNLKIFLLGFIVSSIIEYISSFIQEKVFHTKSWDYSNFPLNINGRVNLIYSIVFGLVSILWYKLFFNIVNSILNLNYIYSISFLLIVFIFYDIFISIFACLRYYQRKSNKLVNNKFWKYFDRKYPDKVIKKIFANAEFV